jgi:hypothetical protein
MSALAPTFTATPASGISVGAVGGLYAFIVFYLGYAYFDVFPPAGDT